MMASMVVLAALLTPQEMALRQAVPGLLAKMPESGRSFEGKISPLDGKTRGSDATTAALIYDDTLQYRTTAFRRHLDAALEQADAALAGVADPPTPTDAVLASALLELSQYVDAGRRMRYREAAVRQLTALTSPRRFQPDDYYLREALLRVRELEQREAARAEVRAQLAPRMSLPETELAARARFEVENARDVAEAALRKPIPDTADALYEEFWSTGNRTHYQKVFFARVKNVAALALAEAQEKKGRYLPRLAEYLAAFCAMKTWVLPAHDFADGGRGNLRGTIQTVDLFSSEVAATLACILRVVGDRLDPALVARVRTEAERRIFAPLRRDLAGGGVFGKTPRLQWWMVCENNWNAVCWDNTVCAALGFLEDDEDRALFVDAARRAVAPYLRGFTSDGYCSEGMGYWNYGFGHHLLMGRLLRAVTQGRLDIFTQPVQRAVAAYPRAYTLCEGLSPAFADGNGAASKSLLAYVDEIWPDLPKTMPPASVFPVGQVWLLRDPSGLSVAFKGGHNDELHNHNDIGSYAVAKGGVFIGGEPGGEEYTRFTFSRHRYESKVLNSYGHPVPVVGGRLQETGRKAAARVLAEDVSSPCATVVLDLKDAYKVPSLKVLTRTFVHDRAAKTFTVRDHVEFSEPTAFESVCVMFRRADNPKTRGPYGWDVKPKIVVTGGSYSCVEETIPNPNRLVPYRVGIRLDRPVLTADIAVTY